MLEASAFGLQSTQLSHDRYAYLMEDLILILMNVDIVEDRIKSPSTYLGFNYCGQLPHLVLGTHRNYNCILLIYKNNLLLFRF